MTIKDLAEELKISPQAVYQRLKRNNVDVKKLTDIKTKELTADGEYAIRQLFSQDAVDFKPTKQALVEEYSKQVETLNIDKAKLEERVKALEAEVSSLQTDKDNLTKALLQAQELHQKTVERLLPAGKDPDPVKLSWRERLTGRRHK